MKNIFILDIILRNIFFVQVFHTSFFVYLSISYTCSLDHKILSQMAPDPSVESPLSMAKIVRDTTFDIYDEDNKIFIFYPRIHN